jgi:DNA-directed RNA polymerase sigma subunit (sigma70/sigma32)
MVRVRQQTKRVERLEEELEAAGRQYLQALRDAHESGMSLAAIGADLGVSRQRVRQLLPAAQAR